MVFERDTDATTTGISTGRHSFGRAASLDDVFDDPAHGDVGRDRLGVHFAWEGVLFLGVLVLGYLLLSNHKPAVTGNELKSLLVFISAFGLIATGAAMSLRVAAPNLALGPIALASGLWYARNSESDLFRTTGLPLALALAVGLGIAILVVGFQVPAWAGSLVALLAVLAWIQVRFPDDVVVAGGFNPINRAFYILGGFAALSLVAGLLGLIKPIRRGVGRFRPVADPAARRGGTAATVSIIGLLGSSVLASAGGILLAANSGAADEPVQVSASFGLEWTALAMGAALIGGTSAFGRRGGLFGTILGTTVIALLMVYSDRAGWDISPLLLAGGAVATGLVVTRLVETFGRPLSVDDSPDDWTDVGVGGATTTATTWSTPTTTGDPWAGLSSQPTSPSTTTTATQWGDTDRWR
jgi:ribose/xylose/arabinose/galactoside ABC-type transport system permease subunit